MATIEERLKLAVSAIEKNDNELSKELRSVRKDQDRLDEALEAAPLINAEAGDSASLESLDTGAALETIVLKVGRPVLTVFNNEAQLVFNDAESEVWKERLTKAKKKISAAIPSVGRIEVGNNSQFDWLGTGWLVYENIVVTNRHVAELFGRSNGANFVFRQGSNGSAMTAAIDLLEEANNDKEFTFSLHKILHIEPEPGPDMAFLAVKPINRKNIPPPIKLSAVNSKIDVAVIGYPARDSRIPDQQLMEKIFGDVYNKKRLAPGQITNVTATKLFHDCSTLGGCSGGAIIDLKTGHAVGLHFAGRFLESNFAVPATLVSQRLKQIKGKAGTNASFHATGSNTTNDASSNNGADDNQDKQPDYSNTDIQLVASGGSVNQNVLTIPLQLIVGLNGHSGVVAPKVVASAANEVDLDDFAEEAKPEDYKDRKGYDPGFLGDGFKAPLPTAVSEKRKNDILNFKVSGKNEQVLKYEHFSVVMSKSRRICLFSAVNIDGKKSKKAVRVSWRLDPRIPTDAQIMKECYGNPPKFSRGHMTRREDPVWGTEDTSLRGNADSMCVTNTVPQMQSFNAPIWLALEDYALNHAREDKMRISVMTGPVMRPNDPVYFGVKVPVQFWKIIIFIHDETGKPCATGYMMNQKEQLPPEEEFIFGKFNTAQRSIASIERATGLSFGKLSTIDGFLKDGQEAPDMPLSDLAQIRF